MSDPIEIRDYDPLIREILASGGEFRMYPHGVSMLPLIRQGRDSVALVALDALPRKNDILFYQREDGSYILHRVKETAPEGLALWGDNQLELEQGVLPDQIIGRVVRIFRDDREVNCAGLGYRGYVFFWQCRLLRR